MRVLIPPEVPAPGFSSMEKKVENPPFQKSHPTFFHGREGGGQKKKTIREKEIAEGVKIGPGSVHGKKKGPSPPF